MPTGRRLAQRGQQPLRVAGHRPDPLRAERLRHRGHHGAAVGHHVRDAAGHPDVVLQHPDVTLGRTDQVDAADVDPNAVRRLDAPDRAVVVAGGGDQLARDHPVGDHLAVGVDVGQKGFQGTDPLGDAGVDDLPVVGRDDPRHHIQREGSLDAADVEGDPGLEVVAGQRLRDRPQLVRGGPPAASRTRWSRTAGPPRRSRSSRRTPLRADTSRERPPWVERIGPLVTAR